MTDVCKFCSKGDTKYSCIKCKVTVCNICALAAPVDAEGYNEESYSVGICPNCFTKKDDEITVPEPKKQSTIFSMFGLTEKPSTSKSNKKEATKATKKAASKKESAVTSRTVSKETVQKWKEELVEYSLHDWLTCTFDKKGNAETLKCIFCIKYEDKIRTVEGFTKTFINGSTNYRRSSVLYHAKDCKAHTKAYELYLKDKNISTEETTSKLSKLKHGGVGSQDIVSGITLMDKKELEKTKIKFETAYFVAKQELPFTKYNEILKLEKKHGVIVGDAYTNDKAAGIFIDYLGKDLKQNMEKDLRQASFYSVLSDGSTDVSVVEDEVVYVMHFDPEPENSDKVQVKLDFAGLKPLKSQCATGVFDAIHETFTSANIDNYAEKLVGFTSDGASVNRGDKNSVKLLLREKSPWVTFIWCIAHRLELALKDALSGQADFELIDNLLLRMFYLYNKAPKKLRQLKELFEIFKDGVEFDAGGVKPIKCNGTRWIKHKLDAMKLILDKWGLYIAHLENLCNDKSIPKKDQAKLKGYLKDWRRAKVPFLLAIFIDLLSIAARLSLTFQSNEIDHVSAYNALSKSKTLLRKFRSREFEDLPYVKNLLSKINVIEGKHYYQDIELKNYETEMSYVKRRKELFQTKVAECIENRLEDEDESADLFKTVPKILNCEGWERTDNDGNFEVDFLDDEVEALAIHFEEPLTNAGLSGTVPDLLEEWHELLIYANEFIKLNGVSYLKTWRKLFVSPRRINWKNILLLIKLLFTLPISNAKLERMFSKLKRLKTAYRASLGFCRLEHLLRINEDGPSIESIDVMPAIESWASEKKRRIIKKPRKKYEMVKNRKRTFDTLALSSSSEEVSDIESEVDLFEGVEDFIIAS